VDAELWAVVPEAPAYEVSTCGRVRRGAFEVASWPNKKGYHLVSIEIDGEPRLRYVHRLVLAAFRGPAAGRLGHHGDGLKGHNVLDNLAWATRSQNVQHAWAAGLIPGRHRRLEKAGQLSLLATG
jgi:hypothetical protein